MKLLAFLVFDDATITFSEVEKLWNTLWPQVTSFLIQLVIALLVFFIGKKLIKLILKLTQRGLKKAKVEQGVESFVISLVRILLFAVIICIIAEILGMPTTSFVAVLGSAGLAIGLALQGSLSNFAGGVLILVLKPFRVGDYIIANGNEGTVTSIDIFYTKILTGDNRVVVLPNGSLSNSSIMNVTNEQLRRLDLIIPIGYQDDIQTAKEVLRIICSEKELIQKDHDIEVFVSAFGSSAVELMVRVWVVKENYFALKSELLEQIKYTFDEKNISIPFNRLDVTIQK